MLQLKNIVISHNKRELEVEDLTFKRGSITTIDADQKSDIDLLTLCLTGMITHNRGELTVDGSKFSILKREKMVGFYSINYPDPPFLVLRDYINYSGKLKGVDKNVLSSRLSWFESFFELNSYLKLNSKDITPFLINLARLFNSIVIRDSIIVMFEPMLYFSGEYSLSFNRLLDSLKESGATIVIVTYGLGNYDHLSDSKLHINRDNTFSKVI